MVHNKPSDLDLRCLPFWFRCLTESISAIMDTLKFRWKSPLQKLMRGNLCISQDILDVLRQLYAWLLIMVDNFASLFYCTAVYPSSDQMTSSSSMYTDGWRFTINVYIMKICLFKYTENFTTKNWKFSDKKFWYFTYFCSKHRMWVFVRTGSSRRF